MTGLRGLLTAIAGLSLIAVIAFFGLAPKWIDQFSNQVVGDPGRSPTAKALALHNTLTIGDLHADAALWGKDLLADNDWGHVDLPKLLAGGAALQMFTTVTKSPRGQNYDSNATDAPDNITLLALAQRWPSEAKTSLLARALLQAERIHAATERSPSLAFIRSRTDLENLLSRRGKGETAVSYTHLTLPTNREV